MTGEREPIRFPRDPRTMTAEEVWAVMESTPGFNESLRKSEAELAAGGGVLYDVRDGELVKVDAPPRHPPVSTLEEPVKRSQDLRVGRSTLEEMS